MMGPNHDRAPITLRICTNLHRHTSGGVRGHDWTEDDDDDDEPAQGFSPLTYRHM